MRYGITIFLCFAIALVSCNNDDDDGVVEVPPRLLAEVATEDHETIKEFLNTHFYNYEDFDTPPSDFDYKIVIDTIAGENAGKKPLMEDAVPLTIKVSSNQFGLSEEETDVEHTYYYIEVREGEGGSPTYADSTLDNAQTTIVDLIGTIGIIHHLVGSPCFHVGNAISVAPVCRRQLLPRKILIFIEQLTIQGRTLISHQC